MKKLILALALIPSLSFADTGCDLPSIVAKLRPGAQQRMNGTTYAGLVWLDAVQTKPTQAEVSAAVTSCQQAYATGQIYRDEAAGLFVSTATDTSQRKVVRGVALVSIDEINLIREWVMSFKAAVAAATTLADLKTRVAALPDLPDRTAVQAKTAVQNKITSGAAD